MGTLKKAEYFPILRTRDAEMKGFCQVMSKTLDRLVPVFELTRSRRSKNNADGDVGRSISKITDCIDDREFIVDVTSMTSQQNSELQSLLDPSNGFDNWVTFVRDRLPPFAIPVVHLTAPFDKSEFSRQMTSLQAIRSSVVLRVANEYTEFDDLLAALVDHGVSQGVYVLLDAGYLTKETLPVASSTMHERGSLLIDAGIKKMIIAGSSFPNSVVQSGLGGDSYGAFDLLEIELSTELRRKLPVDIIHGDYGCIHPNEFKATVTNWVPRVDIPLKRSVYYYRYRRAAGGYIEAAKKALADEKYVALDCWADHNIRDAAAGDPGGRNPSHWIAVRVNFHIERRLS